MTDRAVPFEDLQIDKKLMQAAGMASRVGNEVEIHCRLKHPTILEVGGCGSPAHVCIYMQLYNYFEDGNYVYLVLEMAACGELNRYLKTSRRKLNEAEGQRERESLYNISYVL